jgi:hypothetical protein
MRSRRKRYHREQRNAARETPGSQARSTLKMTTAHAAKITRMPCRSRGLEENGIPVRIGN